MASKLKLTLEGELSPDVIAALQRGEPILGLTRHVRISESAANEVVIRTAVNPPQTERAAEAPARTEIAASSEGHGASSAEAPSMVSAIREKPDAPFTIFVRGLEGQSWRFHVWPTTTLGTLMKEMEGAHGIPVERQRYNFGDKILSSANDALEWTTLDQLGIKADSVLTLLRQGDSEKDLAPAVRASKDLEEQEKEEEKQKTVRLMVRDLAGGTYNYIIPQNALASDLAAQICDKQQVPVDDQRLIYGGKCHFNGYRGPDLPLASSGIKDGSIVWLVLRLRKPAATAGLPVNAVEAGAQVSGDRAPVKGVLVQDVLAAEKSIKVRAKQLRIVDMTPPPEPNAFNRLPFFRITIKRYVGDATIEKFTFYDLKRTMTASELAQKVQQRFQLDGDRIRLNFRDRDIFPDRWTHKGPGYKEKQLWQLKIDSGAEIWALDR